MISLEKGIYMDWVRYFGLLVPVIALFGFLYRELKDWRSETREEIEGIRQEIRQQAASSDQLYQMFIDLLKDQKARP